MGSKYWHYSVNEMGLEDITAQIDHIHVIKCGELNIRGQAGIVAGTCLKSLLPGLSDQLLCCSLIPCVTRRIGRNCRLVSSVSWKIFATRSFSVCTLNHEIIYLLVAGPLAKGFMAPSTAAGSATLNTALG